MGLFDDRWKGTSYTGEYDMMSQKLQHDLRSVPGDLERCCFLKNRDGGYTFDWSIGWHGGYHSDGCGAMEPLPEAWFAGGWEGFLEAFCRRYPGERYGYGREKLCRMKGLREFLGL